MISECLPQESMCSLVLAEASADRGFAVPMLATSCPAMPASLRSLLARVKVISCLALYCICMLHR